VPVFPSPTQVFCIRQCAAGCDLLFRRDLHGLASCRIVALARGVLADLEAAETGDPYTVALLQILDHLRDEVVHQQVGVLLAEFIFLSEVGVDAFQRDCWFWSCRFSQLRSWEQPIWPVPSGQRFSSLPFSRLLA
jgi:hypothetical protein